MFAKQRAASFIYSAVVVSRVNTLKTLATSIISDGAECVPRASKLPEVERGTCSRDCTRYFCPCGVTSRSDSRTWRIKCARGENVGQRAIARTTCGSLLHDCCKLDELRYVIKSNQRN